MAVNAYYGIEKNSIDLKWNICALMRKHDIGRAVTVCTANRTMEDQSSQDKSCLIKGNQIKTDPLVTIYKSDVIMWILNVF